MIHRDLTSAETEALLVRQCYAHIGFTGDDGRISVLPISYIYENGIFYSFSDRASSKLAAMHAHPQVCIQVEELDAPNTWRSVQAWGTYAEASTEQIGRFSLLVEEFWQRADKGSMIFSVFRDFMDNPQKKMALYTVTVESMVAKEGGHGKNIF
jgi:nitroimidazol reductase NimA-like FMN-containing flavoprotein (pyridoxamine 5'-phosphate oxidase superfamily)